ncbi:hypothetical protein QJS10_CPA10g01313 [Acorus calamus]|uniref:Origin of replication complex subunit 3 n=1 Tax=Acorus calamus TaxID=4465 RepID=A0AAV9E1K7_ACOCL|nr:hypothetical protein QJS10_CPA10g01313 [Acorus calamus]
MERCQGSVLADFILMLSEWVVKIPVVLIMGVTTTVDAPRRLLPSNALQQLRPCKFMLGSPTERMNAIVEAVLLRPCSGFTVGYKVALFLRDYFTRHDGTVTSFIKAMKIACMKHFSMEPLSFLGCGIFDEHFQSFSRDVGESLPYAMLKYAFDLPSCQREQFAERTVDTLTNGLAELKKLWDCWSSVVLCIYEAAKHSKVQLLDIVCEAHDPSLCNLRATNQYLPTTSTDYSPHNEGFPLLRKVGVISRAVHKVRDLPAVSLSHLLNILEGHTQEMAEVHQKVRELQLALRSEDDGNNIKPAAIDLRKRSIYRSPLNVEKGSKKLNEKASILMEDMIRDYLKPIESAPFHEIICFKHVDVLQSALIGDPRKMIQVDLVKSKNYLQCSCCRSGGVLLASMHDTSLMYSLAREHGDLINLHDWYQSFKAVVSVSSAKNKRKMPKSPSKKKKLAADLAPDTSEATLQARFCRAVTELQITGLLRMPSKRRPDFVQRVAFGI